MLLLVGLDGGDQGYARCKGNCRSEAECRDMNCSDVIVGNEAFYERSSILFTKPGRTCSGRSYAKLSNYQTEVLRYLQPLLRTHRQPYLDTTALP